MNKYPHAVTQKCGSCGRTFTCKGEGWNLSNGKCPYANTDCWCEKCHHGKSRVKCCEEISLKEVVLFT